MYYRAIKMTNGGEEVEFRHFGTLFAAYTWLLPEANEDKWEIKSYPVIVSLCEKWSMYPNLEGCHNEVVGWTKDSDESTHYLQRVTSWQDPLPNF